MLSLSGAAGGGEAQLANSASSDAVTSILILMDMSSPSGDHRSVMIRSDAISLSDAGLVRMRNTAGSDMDVGGGIIKKYKATRSG